MRTLLALALLAPLLLTGCREYVVYDVPEPAQAPAPEGIAIVQLKGPSVVLINQPYSFKAEDKSGVRYEWVVVGPAGIAGSGTDSRYYRGIALEPGEATIRVYLHDQGTDDLVGYADREVRVAYAR